MWIPWNSNKGSPIMNHWSDESQNLLIEWNIHFWHVNLCTVLYRKERRGRTLKVDESESQRRSVKLDSLQLHGLIQARVLESVAFLFSRSSQPRDWTQVSCTAGGFFTSWTTREAQEYWMDGLSLLQGIFPTQEWNRIAGEFFTNWAIRKAL